MNKRIRNLLSELIREELDILDALIDITPADKLEHSKEHGGSKMAKAQLFHIAKEAQSLHDRMEEMDELPEWAKSKIAVIKYALSSVYDHFDYKKHKEDHE
ncbi:MAG: hypothetical protein CMB77_04615 [Euryarchaeota archaeon]|nr:hypothetical protein [Euryarchaeota archaeon]|tara:strand:+ start:4839 stop:5141 length:303 start_codon:yes stop_codon:yes gene_type:complete